MKSQKKILPIESNRHRHFIRCFLPVLLFSWQLVNSEQRDNRAKNQKSHFKTERVSLSSPLAVPKSFSEDWPNFLGPRSDGTSAEKNLIQTWPSSGPQILWSRALGASYSAPVTSRGRLILFHRLQNQEVIESVDAFTGELIWKQSYPSFYVDEFGYNGGPRSSPTIEGEHVYTFGAEGKLTCLDFGSGEILWQHWINRDLEVPTNFFGVGVSPVIDGDRILLNVGGGQMAGIVAINKKNGVILWKSGEDKASYSTPIIRSIHGIKLGIFFTRQGLNVLETQTGKSLYRYPFRSRNHFSVNAASPVVVDDYIFLSASYRTGSVLFQLSPIGLQVVWKDSQAMRNHWSTSIYYQGYLYGMDGRHEGGSRFRCIEFLTGKVLWTAKQGLGRAAFILAEGNLIALGERGTLALIEATPERYIERSRAQILQYPCWTPPILSHGRLYVRNETRLICLDLREGK